jgi:hypothetical protein
MVPSIYSRASIGNGFSFLNWILRRKKCRFFLSKFEDLCYIR